MNYPTYTTTQNGTVGHALTVVDKIVQSIFGTIILFLGAFVIVNWPIYVFRYSVDWPDWIHHLLIALGFCYLGFMCWWFSRPRYFSQYKNDTLLGKMLPLMVAFSFFFLSSGCFGVLTAELAEHRLAILVPSKEITPSPRPTSFSDVSDYYLVQALDLVPSFDIPKTLRMKNKFEYLDNGTGWLVLVFKFIIVWIAIYHIKRWNEWRKEKNRKVRRKQIARFEFFRQPSYKNANVMRKNFAHSFQTTPGRKS